MYTFVFFNPSDKGSYIASFSNVETEFDLSVLDDHVTNYKVHVSYNYYYAQQKYERHILHKMSAAVNDQHLSGSMILEIQDDMEALAFRLSFDKFIKGKAQLVWLIQDMDIDILNQCPTIEWLVARDSNRQADTSAVMAAQNSLYDCASAFNNLNGVVGLEVETLWKAFEKEASNTLGEYRNNIKESLATLNKERKVVKKYLDTYNKK